MKNLILCAACLMLMGAPLAAGSADADFGLGIVLGAPSGISAKIPTGTSNSVDLILGYGLNDGPGCCRDGGRLYMGGDYLWYNYSLIHVSKGKLPLYYGPGINASFANNSKVGVRGVIGLEYQFSGAPFDVFFELGPGIKPRTPGPPDLRARW